MKLIINIFDKLELHLLLFKINILVIKSFIKK